MSSQGIFRFLGKLLLKSDHDSIIEALESQNKQHEAGLLRTPFLNEWIEKLFQDSSIIQQLYENHEHTDIQTLRQLLRTASKENANTKKNKRKLFEHLRYMDRQEPLPY